MARWWPRGSASDSALGNQRLLAFDGATVASEVHDGESRDKVSSHGCDAEVGDKDESGSAFGFVAATVLRRHSDDDEVSTG